MICLHCHAEIETWQEESLDPPRVYHWVAQCDCAYTSGHSSESRALDELSILAERRAESVPELVRAAVDGEADTVPEWSEVG